VEHADLLLPNRAYLDSDNYLYVLMSDGLLIFENATTTPSLKAHLSSDIGGADDLLSAVVLAYEGRVVLAPAMNDVMWRNGATQQNLGELGNRGYRVIPPGTGDLACGYEAEGRMAEPEVIADYLEKVFAPGLGQLRVLVSAGGTEEDLDPVRVISNRSTGKMGFAIAAEARDRGAAVTVVTGRVSAPPPHGVSVVPVRTADEMSAALKEAFVDSDVLVMVAAVSDFRPKAPVTNKIKERTWSLELERTEDILEALGKMKGKRYIIGFAVETDNIDTNAMDKLKRKNCDLIVVNNPLEPGAAFDHDTNAVSIYNSAGKVCESGLKSKREIAEIILLTAQQEEAFKKILV